MVPVYSMVGLFPHTHIEEESPQVDVVCIMRSLITACIQILQVVTTACAREHSLYIRIGIIVTV